MTKLNPLPKGNMYFDPALNAILQADGDISSCNTHNMTMLWPTYSALDMPDSTTLRLVPAKYDQTTQLIEYYDPNFCKTITMNLHTGQIANTQSTSQQNWGWASKDEEKKLDDHSFPFKVGCTLFHKRTRTKWLYVKLDRVTSCPIVQSLQDKEQMVSIFKSEYPDYEEIFF